jgi:hypothetical protein
MRPAQSSWSPAKSHHFQAVLKGRGFRCAATETQNPGLYLQRNALRRSTIAFSESLQTETSHSSGFFLKKKPPFNAVKRTTLIPKVLWHLRNQKRDHGTGSCSLNR